MDEHGGMPPSIAYPGGKARLAQKIISLLPKSGELYCEPFVGRGNLFWAAATAGLQYKKWWLNDTATIPFFRAIKQIGDVIEIPERGRWEFERKREAFKSGDPTAILLEPLLSFAGGGFFSAGHRGSKRGGVSSLTYQRTMRECHSILHTTSPRLSSLDWRNMNLEDLGTEATILLDPPYPDAEVRTYSDASVDYVELVDTLLRAKFRWALCGYAHPAWRRLGHPSWAQDVRFLYFPNAQGRKCREERRIECVWTNYRGERSAKSFLPPPLLPQLRIQDGATSLSFTDLDAKIDRGLGKVVADWEDVLPYLLEMRSRLCAPGRRTDLRRGAPYGLTWTEWCHSKRQKLGKSLRTIQYLLKGKTDASLARQTLTQRRAELRYVPSLSLAVNQMHCEDCVTLMDRMPASSVGLIVTSPPHNLKNSTGNGMMSASSDGPDDAMAYDDYVKWQRECLTAMMRVLSEDGAIFYNYKWTVRDGLLQDGAEIVKGFPVRQIIIWEKNGGLNFKAGYFLRSYEFIYLVTKPDFKLAPSANAIPDVWHIPQESDNPHPAPYPVELARRCIQATNAELVLDPFMGSGSTAIAAEACNRNWIGFEISEDYYKLSNERIETARKLRHSFSMTPEHLTESPHHGRSIPKES